jgi:hypothetical protein
MGGMGEHPRVDDEKCSKFPTKRDDLLVDFLEWLPMFASWQIW